MESLEVLIEDRSTSTSYHTTWPRLSRVIRFHSQAFVFMHMRLSHLVCVCSRVLMLAAHLFLLARIHYCWYVFVLNGTHSFSLIHTHSSLCTLILACVRGSFVAVVHVVVEQQLMLQLNEFDLHFRIFIIFGTMNSVCLLSSKSDQIRQQCWTVR